MTQPSEERRKFSRFDTEVQIYFRVSYDVKTRVEYQEMDKQKDEALSPKYEAFSKNVSAAGMSFVSGQECAKGKFLLLEVYMPKSKEPILMQGEAVWCRETSSEGGEKQFETGVELLTVNGEPVKDTISEDSEYHIVWSNVLEAVLGNFKNFAKKCRKEGETSE